MSRYCPVLYSSRLRSFTLLFSPGTAEALSTMASEELKAMWKSLRADFHNVEPHESGAQASNATDEASLTRTQVWQNRLKKYTRTTVDYTKTAAAVLRNGNQITEGIKTPVVDDAWIEQSLHIEVSI